MFSAHGFRGATIDQIAEAAEMSKPNLLYYFPSKEAIHVSLLSALMDTWLDPLRELDADGDRRQPVEAGRAGVRVGRLEDRRHDAEGDRRGGQRAGERREGDQLVVVEGDHDLVGARRAHDALEVARPAEHRHGGGQAAVTPHAGGPSEDVDGAGAAHAEPAPRLQEAREVVRRGAGARHHHVADPLAAEEHAALPPPRSGPPRRGGTCGAATTTSRAARGP